jgi:hypothetical protein
LNAANTIN